MSTSPLLNAYLCFIFFLMIRRPPRSTLFPYTNALPISYSITPRGSTELVELSTSFARTRGQRSEEHTSELQSRLHLECRLLFEKKNMYHHSIPPRYLRPTFYPLDNTTTRHVFTPQSSAT